MPIYGLTDTARMPLLGKIHLGYRDDRGVPHATDHFVVPEEVEVVYGDKPKSFPIRFASDDIDSIASTFWRSYQQSRGLVCRGTAITARRLVKSSEIRVMTADEGNHLIVEAEIDSNNPQFNRNMEGNTEPPFITGPIVSDPRATDTEWIQNIPCPGEECEYAISKSCRRSMLLQFVLPDVAGLGVWQIDTGSIYSILNVHNSLRLIASGMPDHRIRGVPLVLELVPQVVTPAGKSFTRWILNIRSDMTMAALAAAPASFGVLNEPADDSEQPETIAFGDEGKDPPENVDHETGELLDNPQWPEPDADESHDREPWPDQFEDLGKFFTFCKNHRGLTQKAVAEIAHRVEGMEEIKTIPNFKPFINERRLWDAIDAAH